MCDHFLPGKNQNLLEPSKTGVRMTPEICRDLDEQEWETAHVNRVVEKERKILLN